MSSSKPLATEKLQKILARAGLGSRRALESFISAGRVSVNGEIAKLGDRVFASAQIKVDGKLVNTISAGLGPHRFLLYYKPEGEVCTRHDPDDRPTVFDRLPIIENGRWISIGRLDLNSSGLLIFTTDGELANRWMHPKNVVEREYQVRVLGEVTDAMIALLLKGVMLEDGLARFKSIEFTGGSGANRWYRVVLTEGRKREVRRLWESQGCTVSRLIRVRFGSIVLPRTLRAGESVEVFLADKV